MATEHVLEVAVRRSSPAPSPLVLAALPDRCAGRWRAAVVGSVGWPTRWHPVGHHCQGCQIPSASSLEVSRSGAHKQAFCVTCADNPFQTDRDSYSAICSYLQLKACATWSRSVACISKQAERRAAGRDCDSRGKLGLESMLLIRSTCVVLPRFEVEHC
jgi:hypothetical protein